MCSRREVREAQQRQDAAAEALARTCPGPCSDDIGKALHSLYDTSLKEPIPEQMSELLGRLQ